MLDKQTVRAALIAVLRHVQKTSGRPCPEISDATKPIGDLQGFDSLLAVEATVLLEQKLGCALTDVPFTSESGTRALRVGGIIERTLSMILPEEVA